MRPAVAAASTALGALDDPWGVGSWWVSPPARLTGERAPVDLVDTEEEDRLLRLARATAPGVPAFADTPV